jgi:hypothetical protein
MGTAIVPVRDKLCQIRGLLTLRIQPTLYQRLDLSQKALARDQDAVAALAAADANVGAKADDIPLIAATRMGFAETDHISELNILVHGGIITWTVV